MSGNGLDPVSGYVVDVSPAANDLRAYDRLPPRVREVLRNASLDLSAQDAERQWRLYGELSAIAAAHRATESMSIILRKKGEWA
ncbi:DUF6525 family protein [Rhodomicrobium lacus]|uniref:DUF6525 family protein n=1 Tax=Rhodomicrobium lacus TaxID=2498452 RepID=UPI003CCB07E6